MIADSLYRLGNYSEAINQYAKDGSATSKLQIARAYNAIGNYDKAILEYEGLIASNNTSNVAQFELGKLYFKLGRFQKANGVFYALTQEENDNPEYYYYMGETYRQMANDAGSLVAYKYAVAIDSTHLRSLFQLGRYFVVKKEKQQALHFIDMGLRFYEDDVALLNLKALAMFNDYDYKGAAPLFERLLELREEKPHIYEKLGHSYYQLWEFEKAKKMYRDLLKFPDFAPDAYNGLGYTFYKERQIDSAEVYFKKAITAKKPNLSQEYTALASLARTRKDLESALSYYRLAYNEDETDHRAYYQICTVADQYYKDPKAKWELYEGFIKKFGAEKTYLSDFVKKRISELKQEIHMAHE
ncbi:tetratricopeptide repeat protein [Maribacter algicola]|uniref:Tetratricopeptide repeat protein n=1 Tax=Meishania litoralis TaxID=3434685 RepID=A0ACC7LGB5_9FLAO